MSISEGARLAGKPRSTLQRHIKDGKLSREVDGQRKPVIDTSELQRVYGCLLQPGMEQPEANGHSAAPVSMPVADVLQAKLESAERENALLRAQLEDLRTDRDHWRQQATALLTNQRSCEASDEPTMVRLIRAWKAFTSKPPR